MAAVTASLKTVFAEMTAMVKVSRSCATLALHLLPPLAAVSRD